MVVSVRKIESFYRHYSRNDREVKKLGVDIEVIR